MQASPVDAMRPYRPVLLLAAVLIAPQGLALPAARPLATEIDTDRTDTTSLPPPSPAVPLEDIARFVEVFRRVQADFVDPLDDRALMRAATRALLADLDPHSAFLPAAAANAWREQAAGAYDGIGVEVEVRPDRSLRVIGTIDGSPAQRAGLRTGDVIVAVDGRPVGLRREDEPSRALRGTAGEGGGRLAVSVLSVSISVASGRAAGSARPWGAASTATSSRTGRKGRMASTGEARIMRLNATSRVDRPVRRCGAVRNAGH